MGAEGAHEIDTVGAEGADPLPIFSLICLECRRRRLSSHNQVCIVSKYRICWRVPNCLWTKDPQGVYVSLNPLLKP